MADSVADARQEVINARRAANAELDELGSSAREAVNIPAKIKRNPVKAAGLLGGAAFLAVGGPKRLLRRAEKRVLPRRRVQRLVPEEIEKAVAHLPEEQRDEVMAHIERDFKTYLQRAHVREQPSARRSFWGTYDTFVAIFGAAAARELLKRFMTAPKEAEAEGAEHEAKAAEKEAEAAQTRSRTP